MESAEFHSAKDEPCRSRDDSETQLIDHHHHHLVKAKLNVKPVVKAAPTIAHSAASATHTHKKAAKSGHKVTHKAIRLKPAVKTPVPAEQSGFVSDHDEHCEEDDNNENEQYVLHPAVQRMVTSLVSVASTLRSNFSSKSGSQRSDGSVKADGFAIGASAKASLNRTLSVGSFSPSISTAVSFNTACDSTVSFSTRFPHVQADTGEEGCMSADFSFDHADVDNGDGDADLQQDTANAVNPTITATPHTAPHISGVSASATDMYFPNLMQRSGRHLPIEDSFGFEDDAREGDNSDGMLLGAPGQGEQGTAQPALEGVSQRKSHSNLACPTRSMSGSGSDRVLAPSTMSSISSKLRAMLFRYDADCDDNGDGNNDGVAGQVYQPYTAASSGSGGGAESGGFSLVRMLLASVSNTMSRKQQVFPSG